MAPEVLRPLIASELELDLHGGAAWVGIVAFEIHGTRAPILPAIPGLSDAREINLRTYVHRDGVPGVWFLSMEVDNLAMASAARAVLGLPYRHASISWERHADTFEVKSERQRGWAHFEAAWKTGDALASPRSETLEHFLLERHVLYAKHGPVLYRQHVLHPPWPLRQVEVVTHRSDLSESVGLPHLSGAPIAHCSDGVVTDISVPEILRVLQRRHAPELRPAAP